MPTPVIGITTTQMQHEEYQVVGITKKYVQAVAQAGGAPLLVPLGQPLELLQALWPRLDGLLLTGGGDIDPRHYGGEPHPSVNNLIEERDVLEMGLFQSFLARRKPFFGICRGIQLINVALGGSLYTHIPDQHPEAIEHAFYPKWPPNHLAHSVKVLDNSRLRKILDQEQVQVNSRHHQGIRHLAPGLNPTAYAPDGMVEGVELGEYPFGLAVQWHPEWLQEHEPMRRLFEAFVEAATLEVED